MREVVKNTQRFLVKDNPWWDVFDSGWESESFAVLDTFLTRETNYIDAGAWIGPLALYAAGLSKQVYALEPDPTAFAELHFNIRASGLSNVTLFNEALYSYDGTIKLSGDLGDSMTRVGMYKTPFQVNCHTLETFVSQHGVADPLFIKMDVENAEEAILEKIDFFEKRKPTLFLSLHPQWFRDPIKGLETARRVGRLYNHCWSTALGEIDIESDTAGPWIFFD
jgi:FkbM family methyltransferase